MDACEVLNKAADLIEEKGWTQGSYYKDGAFCALGAIREVSGYQIYSRDVEYGDNQDVTELYQKAWGLAERTSLAATTKSLTHYNDTFGTKKEDVVSILRKACE